MNYVTFNEYCQQRFGCKVYKLSIDAGFTCPNRDGTLSIGGCSFCAGGSGRFAVSGDDVLRQLEIAKGFVAQKGAEKFIAFFQAYSGTYAPIFRLKEIYERAISPDYIVALDVATRPDCLGEEVLNLLASLQNVKPVFVELGLQSIHEESIVRMHRCYANDVYVSAVKALKQRGIHVITHFIFGLPGESEEDMLDSVRFAVAAGTDGVKFHVLNVLKGTRLAEEFASGSFALPTLEEYAALLVKAVGLLPEGIVIHRLTGDGDKKILIAPEWVKDKKKCLNTIYKALNDA